MRRAARLDANHNPIRDFLEVNGWSVLSMASLGGGAPDLLVAKGKWSALVEVKDGTKPPSKTKLREGQQSFREKWRGVVITALNENHALMQLEAWRAIICRPDAPR